MNLSRVGQAGSVYDGATRNSTESALRLAATQVSQNIPAGLKMIVKRDQQTNTFVAQLVDRSSGEVKDQFPAEVLLKMAAGLGAR